MSQKPQHTLFLLLDSKNPNFITSFPSLFILLHLKYKNIYVCIYYNAYIIFDSK